MCKRKKNKKKKERNTPKVQQILHTDYCNHCWKNSEKDIALYRNIWISRCTYCFVLNSCFKYTILTVKWLYCLVCYLRCEGSQFAHIHYWFFSWFEFYYVENSCFLLRTDCSLLVFKVRLSCKNTELFDKNVFGEVKVCLHLVTHPASAFPWKKMFFPFFV